MIYDGCDSEASAFVKLLDKQRRTAASGERLGRDGNDTAERVVRRIVGSNDAVDEPSGEVLTVNTPSGAALVAEDENRRALNRVAETGGTNDEKVFLEATKRDCEHAFLVIMVAQLMAEHPLNERTCAHTESDGRLACAECGHHGHVSGGQTACFTERLYERACGESAHVRRVQTVRNSDGDDDMRGCGGGYSVGKVLRGPCVAFESRRAFDA